MEESDSDVEDVYNEINQFMASVGANTASLYEDKDYDIYDLDCLTKEQLAFCDAMDNNLRGRIRILFMFGVFMSQMYATGGLFPL